MLRSLAALALLALLALPATAQIVHDVDADGIWFLGGTDGADTLVTDCVDGNAKANGTDPASGPTPCTEVKALDASLGGDDDFAFLLSLDAFGLDPGVHSVFDGGPGVDLVQFDFRGSDDDLDFAFTSPTGGPPGLRLDFETRPLFVVDLPDPTTRLAVETGTGDDSFFIEVFGATPPVLEVQFFGGPGDDALEAAPSARDLLASFFGGPDDDTFRAGGLDTALLWQPGDGTDRMVGGDGDNRVLILALDALLGMHKIDGFLDPTLCGLFDVNGGGGVIDEGIDGGVFEAGSGGIDLFGEFECGLDEEIWDGGDGTDRSFLRGRAGGGMRLDVDFEVGGMEIFADGFESGDTASWSNTVPRRGLVTHASGLRRVEALGGDDVLWDGIDYQDWPSFTDPATSGPSTVVVRGKPDFPLTIDLGPDATPGRGGAVDSLLVDPLGLPFTDDGSQIVVDGGPPITYAGAEVVRVGAPTAADGGPEAGAPTLAVFPNPTAGAARVRLSGAAGDARVAVVDALGREVAVLHEGPLATGRRTWALGGEGLAPGVYLVRAVGAGWATSRPVVVVR